MIHLRPEFVHYELTANLNITPVNWGDPNLNFFQVSLSGVIGDPTKASGELGAALWRAVVDKVASMIKEFAEMPYH